MANLKPWYQVVTPREDLRENRPLDASEFAVHLDHIRDGRAHDDYVKPERFFDRTYMTGSLLDLSARRCGGYRASRWRRRPSSTWPRSSAAARPTRSRRFTTSPRAARRPRTGRASTASSKAGVSKIPNADVACSWAPSSTCSRAVAATASRCARRPGARSPGSWAAQKAFEVVRQHDEQGISPAGDVIRQMLPNGPVLILMDELLNYMSRFRKLGLADQFYNFLQNLAEEIRARNNVVLCVSIPSSTDIEMNPDDRRDYEALKQMLDRLGKAIIMSVDQEMAEIIRRRLFDWHGMPEDGRKVASAYAEWAVEHAQELTGIDADTAYEQFLAAYPFHPSVLSVFERKWQSLPRFQRTRGVLRMLALWVAHAYQEEHRKAAREPLITLGLAPFENQTFRTAMFEQLGSSELEIPVTTDIVGQADAHAVRLDKEATESIRKAQLHRKIATTIFFESNGGMCQSKAEASVPEISTGVCGPDMNMVDVDNVLEGLASTCFYLNWERNRYRFGLSPNLNQILVTRRGAVEDKRIEERIKQETQTLFQPGSQRDRPPVLACAEQRRAQPPGADAGGPGLRTRQRRPGPRSR